MNGAPTSFDRFGDAGIPLECDVRHDGVMASIVVSGEMDIAGRELLQARADTALASDALATLVIDLSAATFADSVSMTWLARTVHAARDRGLEPHVVVVDGPVLHILRLTGLDRQLNVVRRLPSLVDES